LASTQWGGGGGKKVVYPVAGVQENFCPSLDHLFLPVCPISHVLPLATEEPGLWCYRCFFLLDKPRRLTSSQAFGSKNRKKERRESAKLPKLAFIRSAVYETAFSFWDPRQLWLSVLKAVRTP